MITIPLFPLNAVFYPDGHLALQVFEVRYLDMIRKCIAAGLPFGVVALSHGSEVRKPDQQETFAGVGTIVHPAGRRLSARKVWIAFAVGARGRVHVDAGAKAAVLRDKSLLAPGIRSVEGEFTKGDAVEIVGPDGEVFGKGTVRMDAVLLSGGVDRGVAVHKDDLVVVS